ncbi:MAG: hypothetical protein H7Y38_09420 [Armatimonadetes bacterium]|nr:hypothetical protein [Armatimonadota bacterium]
MEQRFAAVEQHTVFISGVVVKEIIVKGFLAEITKICSDRSRGDIGLVYEDFHLAIKHLATFKLLPYTSDAEAIYRTFKTAKLKGMDGRIAAHALALDFVLVTQNVRDFEDIPGLSVEDWTA